MKKIILFGIENKDLGIFSSIGDDDVTYSFKVKKINSTNEDKHFELDLLPDVLDYFKLNRHIMFKLFETIDEVLDILKDNFTIDIDSALRLYRWLNEN